MTCEVLACDAMARHVMDGGRGCGNDIMIDVTEGCWLMMHERFRFGQCLVGYLAVFSFVALGNDTRDA